MSVLSESHGSQTFASPVFSLPSFFACFFVALSEDALSLSFSEAFFSILALSLSADFSALLLGLVLMVFGVWSTWNGAAARRLSSSASAIWAGDAVFFSYLDAASGRMDVGHTLHSGCPVVEGDKWVLTLWFRKGVSAAEPWERFDPTGARHDATEVVAWDEGLVYS